MVIVVQPLLTVVHPLLILRYNPSKKLKLLEVFDAVRDDPDSGSKVEAFERHPGSLNVPYTTVYPWAEPSKRARTWRAPLPSHPSLHTLAFTPPHTHPPGRPPRACAGAQISNAAGKEYRKSLLSIDKKSRKVGKYADMETELFRRFKAQRAKARKVSPRWLSAMAGMIMKELYSTEVANAFKGGRSWRSFFAKRFKITIRRKTNCKDTTWELTKPVLQTYFRALRRRLQPSTPATPTAPANATSTPALELEPEPDDVPGEWEEEMHSMDPDAVDPGAEFADESDDEDGDGEVLHPFKLPEGFKVAPPPSEAQLTFRDPARAELIDKAILFRWPAVGWCLGKITQANTDARRTIKGVKCNFFIYYELDQDTSQHTLALNAYGADDGWVLLEPM